MRTIDDANRPRAEVAAAWHRIADSNGGLPVSLIAEDVGWSRRYLGSQFRSEYGIGPKDAARIVRFDRAAATIPAGRGSLAEIAVRCGYADQAHLNRDFRDFVGLSPSRWLAADDVARHGRWEQIRRGPPRRWDELFPLVQDVWGVRRR